MTLVNDSGRFFGIGNPDREINGLSEPAKNSDEASASKTMLQSFAASIGGIGNGDAAGHIGASLRPPSSLGTPLHPLNPAEAQPSEAGDKETEAGGITVTVGGKDPGMQEIKPGILACTEFE